MGKESSLFPSESKGEVRPENAGWGGKSGENQGTSLSGRGESAAGTKKKAKN